MIMVNFPTVRRSFQFLINFYFAELFCGGYAGNDQEFYFVLYLVFEPAVFFFRTSERFIYSFQCNGNRMGASVESVVTLIIWDPLVRMKPAANTAKESFREDMQLDR